MLDNKNLEKKNDSKRVDVNNPNNPNRKGVEFAPDNQMDIDKSGKKQ